MRDLQVYLAASVCACHINFRDKGFRQKDVHFFFDLFTNWMEAYLGKKVFIQNTQISRYLENLTQTDFLKMKKDKVPVYYCEDRGILPLFEEMVKIENDDHLELFFFQHHLLEIYQDLLFSTATEKKWHLPHSLKIELKYLLDQKVLIEKQRTRIQKELEKLELRSRETLEMEKLASKLFKQGKDEVAVIAMIEKTFPYQLQGQVRMSEFYGKLVPGLRKLELTVNASRRVETLWKPLMNTYKDYLKRLDELS